MSILNAILLISNFFISVTLINTTSLGGSVFSKHQTDVCDAILPLPLLGSCTTSAVLYWHRNLKAIHLLKVVLSDLILLICTCT